jgi:hypothetical protein
MLWVKGSKPGPSKTSSYIAFSESSLVGGVEGIKELGLGNVGYRASDQMLYLSTISLLEHCKTPNIKRLEQVRGMSRHTEGNNLIILTISLEFDGVVTFMTIKD